MVSFDVVSLFTCVPTDLAVQVARRRLEKDPTLPETTVLLVDDIVNLLTLRLDATFLEFRGKVYQQVHGTAMGSPVSVVIANRRWLCRRSADDSHIAAWAPVYCHATIS